ncbi:histidine phosphatase family protein [Rhodococcus rhodochrous]|uniref:histidine phosphatase family protein n=1 Tax=Rhodococcus rhodochrous TaxID=1829 RepID=UPI0006C84D71|nr:histidine phosphatase family protein [Rhodococcus rhodochrous]
MILTLVRHGEPVRGATGAAAADPSLSPAGRKQLEAARALVDADGYDVVYSSPLRRARESAEILAPGAVVRVDDDLAEFDRATDRYLHWEDGAEIYEAYLAGDLSPWNTTLEEFRRRILDVVERMRGEARGTRVLAVTHGGVVNNFFAMLVGSPRVALFQPGYGSINRFAYHVEEGWTPLELNALGPQRHNL